MPWPTKPATSPAKLYSRNLTPRQAVRSTSVYWRTPGTLGSKTAEGTLFNALCHPALEPSSLSLMMWSLELAVPKALPSSMLAMRSLTSAMLPLSSLLGLACLVHKVHDLLLTVHWLRQCWPDLSGHDAEMLTLCWSEESLIPDLWRCTDSMQ